MDQQNKKRGRPPGKAKTGGRQKGTPNKVTSNLRGAINDLINDNWDLLSKDIKKLEGKDRVAFMEKLFSYSIPKLQSTTVDAVVSHQSSEAINQMSEEQLLSLINKVLEEGE